MNSIFRLISLLVFVTTLAQLSGCDRDNPDPCSKFESITADFIVGETFFGTDTIIDCDTLRRGKSIAFKALGEKGTEDDYESYEWKVGNDPRTFSGKSFTLFFPNVNSIEQIEITLTVKDQFLSQCFLDGGQATLTKTYTLVPRSLSVVYGNYEGALDDTPNDKFIVSIYQCHPDGDICTNNINKGCDNHTNPPLPGPRLQSEISYRTLYLDPQETYFTGCDNPKGWLYFGETINDVIIEYTTGDPNNRTAPRKSNRFTGKRI